MPLIINADDFGLTPGVNRSVAELHQGHALSSATLMATAAFFDHAIAVAQANPTLEVGCHVLLVDAIPALPPTQIPSLCPNGQSLRPDLSRFAIDLHTGRIRASEIEAEATAQIRRLQAAGVRVSHIDTHKHTHVFPRVLKPLLRAARACGVPAIRNPFEPAWARRATPATSLFRNLAIAGLNLHHSTFRHLVQATDLATTDGAIGVLATGVPDAAAALRRLLAAMPTDGTAADAVWEFVCHPGYPDTHLDQVRTRLRTSRATEHAALLDLIPNSTIPLGSWGNLERKSPAFP